MHTKNKSCDWIILSKKKASSLKYQNLVWALYTVTNLLYLIKAQKWAMTSIHLNLLDVWL